MESHSEVFAFRFNPATPGYVAGGCVSGQVVLWDICDRLETHKRRGSTKNKVINKEGSAVLAVGDDDDDVTRTPRQPLYMSNVDFSHNKAVSDLFWLPANTQINYRY